MSELMAKHSGDFLDVRLLDQGIVDDDLLLPWQTVEICIAVCAPLTTVNDIQLVQWKLEPFGKFLDRASQLAGLHRRELVEERLDEGGIYGDGGDLHTHGEEPEVVEERGACFLDDGQETTQDWRSEDDPESETFDFIHDPEAGGLFVETELLFEHEVAVVRLGETDDGADDAKDKHEDQSVGYLALVALETVPLQPAAGDVP